jgi:hypothetical protein
MDLCVLRVDIPREQVILTLCMHAFTKLTLSYAVACSSKQTNKSSKINYETQWGSWLYPRTTEEKEPNELRYRHIHIHLWMKHEKLISRLFFYICVSPHQLDVRQWRWCEMKDPIQITITCARPINNWLGSCRTEKKEKRLETREKAISVFFFSLMFVRSFVPTGMIKY